MELMIQSGIFKRRRTHSKMPGGFFNFEEEGTNTRLSATRFAMPTAEPSPGSPTASALCFAMVAAKPGAGLSSSNSYARALSSAGVWLRTC
jgi:hypothetical protein